MHIALIGATGFVGSAVLDELLRRGHTVTAVQRQAQRLAPRERLRTVAADVLDTAALAHAVEGHELVVSAYNPGWDHPELYARYLDGARAIVAAVRRARVPRLIVVGGAGSLYVAPGVQLVDTPQFAAAVPPNIVPGARAARDHLAELQREVAPPAWTFLSPPAMLAPGARTGRYRLGGDELPMDGDHPAGISVADLAVALVDEAEQPRHAGRRYTVAAG
jgi:putative NADH-flavin reductase